MKMLKQSVTLVLCSFLLILPDLALASSNVQLSSELTTLYRAARKVISDNQAHINKADIGDKGLSGDAVAGKAIENYATATGTQLDVNNLSVPQTAMIDAVKQVMDENQDLINEQGVGFKGFLPAIFARQVANKFNSNMNGKMTIKLTAPKKYVRNRANRPDKWEHNVIETMFSDASYEKGKAFSEQASVKGKSAFRFILPEYYGPSCLSCHGTPKGERDITGGKKEGGVLNELGGAISLIIFQ